METAIKVKKRKGKHKEKEKIIDNVKIVNTAVSVEHAPSSSSTSHNASMAEDTNILLPEKPLELSINKSLPISTTTNDTSNISPSGNELSSSKCSPIAVKVDSSENPKANVSLLSSTEANSELGSFVDVTVETQSSPFTASRKDCYHYEIVQPLKPAICDAKILIAPDQNALVTSGIEICDEAVNVMPTAPVNYDSGDFFSMQSMKQSLDNVGEINFKTMNQIVEEEEAQFRILLPLPRPLEESRISQLYVNYLLEGKERAVQQFLHSVQSSYPGFELYELLHNYLRACNQLQGCEKSLLSLNDQCEDFEKQVWTVSSERLSKTGFCKDDNTVTGYYQIHAANLNSIVFNQLKRVLKDVKELLKDSFPLFVYSVQLCKAQIEHFFYKSFHHIKLHVHTTYPTHEVQNDAELLKLTISTLFLFIRKCQSHSRFLQECQIWLDNSVGLLLRIATLEDHMFILNHVIRCPPGAVSKWASKFVQVPQIPIPTHLDDYIMNSFGHLHLDYSLTVLSCILNRVEKREEYLSHIVQSVQKNSSANDSSLQWVVVDSDGEDEPEDSTSFRETDVVALLHQVPFKSLFARILHVCERDGALVYDERIITEHSILKLIAFCNQLVEILGDGFATYTTDRYGRLIKLLGRLILHVTQYVTEHIDNFFKINPAGSTTVVLVEYNVFLLRTVKILLRGKDVGTLQFLASIPFKSVSVEMLWEIYAILTSWNMYDGNEMKSEDITADFEHELVEMNESNAFYLLTTMSSMAIAREGKDDGFVRIVTIHLFQIGFLSPLTRDSCSKQARDLLASLTRKFPHLISVLIHSIKTKMDILENMSLYLLKELSFSCWRPLESDIHLLSNWLLNFHPYTLESQISRFIIQSLNWNFDESGPLFLTIGLHRKVAILVCESQLKWEKENTFVNWGWEVVRRLHLHGYDYSSYEPLRMTKFLRNLPTFEGHSELEPLRKSVEVKQPLGSFVTLLMTPWGHSLPLISCKGYDLIEVLLANAKFEAVMHVLFFVTPLFASSKESTAELKSNRFLSIVSTVLTSDMTYVRMAKNLIVADFPGVITKMFGEMIDTQLHQYQRFATTERKLVRLWIEILTGCENWNKDNNILYLLDILARFSFYHEECRSYFYNFFIDLYKKKPSEYQTGLTSFLFGWNNSSTTSLLSNPSYPQMPFLIYFILNIEMQIENLNGFWKSMCHSLISPKATVDSAVKKACASAKYSTSVNYLTIYRFAQQALDVPLDCPLSLIFWQKFFVRFFFRIAANENFQGGVGERFFEGIVNTAFSKKLKRRIQELSDFYRSSFDEISDSILRENSDNPAVNPALTIEFYKQRMLLANAMCLWIEDPQLHKDTLYLPALPPQFLPNRLILLLEGSNEDWSEYVDFEVLSHTAHDSMKNFLTSICRLVWIEPTRVVKSPDWIVPSGNHQEDLLKRLNSYDSPIAPPEIPVFRQILPVPNPTMFGDVHVMMTGLKPHFKVLIDFAKLFSLQISQHTALDCSYVEFLPDLYSCHENEALINVRCAGTIKWEPCSGPAHIIFKFTEARLNERVGHQIQQNRTEYHNLLDQKEIQPPPESVCISAVFLEDFITNLVLCHRSKDPHNNNTTKTSRVGRELFYHIINHMNDECTFYPPTRQLFSSFIEILGAEFISVDSEQYKKLVDTCIRNPKVVGALAPHLNLVNAEAKSLIEIYENVANISKRDSDLAFVILTKLDMAAWLDKAKPSLVDKSNLVAIMWRIIISEGILPSDSSQLIHDCYRNHLKIILLHEFPQQYGTILNYLLHGSQDQVVPIEIWYDFFYALSNCTIRFTRGTDSQKKLEMHRFSTESCILQHHLLLETIRMMSNNFTKERLAYGIYGLYPKYRSYAEPIGCFVQMLSYAAIVASLKLLTRDSVTKVTNEVWDFLCELYSPWILPYDQKMVQQQCANWIQQFNFDTSSVLHPWITTDSLLAAVFVTNFAESIAYFVDNVPGSSDVLSKLFNYYLNNFAQPGVKDHVLLIVNNVFINSVPWRLFWPSLSDLEAMNKVAEKYIPAAHCFIGCIFVQINWTEWIQDILMSSSSIQSVEILSSKIHAMILNLTVRLVNDGESRELPLWVELMERAYRLKWNSVIPNTLESIFNWFVMSVDPRVILSLPSNHPMETASLRLLKIASGYTDFEHDNLDLQLCTTPESLVKINRKRYLYMRACCKLLASVASKYKQLLQSEVKNFEKAIQLMIDDIVDTAKHEGNNKKDDLMPPLKELINLMTNHYLGTITRNALIEWCEKHKEAPLIVLYGVIECSLDNKVPAYTTVPLVETAICLCFRHKEATWDVIAEVAVVTNDMTELNSYFEVAYKDGHYLVLYCLFLRRFYHLSQGGLNTVTFLMDVIKNLKPKESNEPVLPLLCDIILKLSVHLLFEAKRGSPVEKNLKKFLIMLAQHLSSLGDDKGGWGLFGALGFLNSSKITARGRLVCRCVSAFVFAQLPLNLPVRTSPQDDGHFSRCGKPHQDCLPNVEKLEALKLNRQYGEFHECIDSALSFIKEPSKCLSLCDIEDFLEKITSFLFTEGFLIKQK